MVEKCFQRIIDSSVCVSLCLLICISTNWLIVWKQGILYHKTTILVKWWISQPQNRTTFSYPNLKKDLIVVVAT